MSDVTTTTFELNATTTTFVNNVVRDYGEAVSSMLEDPTAASEIQNALRDTLVKYFSRTGSQVREATKSKPRAPRAPKATGEAAPAPTDASAASSTAAAAEPKRKAPKKKTGTRRMNGYNMFVQETMKTGTFASEMTCKDKMKECGNQWKVLSDEQKAVWSTKAKEHSPVAAAGETASAPVEATA